MPGRPLNICLVSPGYPPEDGGGIGTFTYHLAKGLSSRNHKVVIVAQSRSEDSKEVKDGIHIFRFKSRYIPKLEQFFPGWAWSKFLSGKINEIVKEFDIDLIEFPNWEGMGLCYLSRKNRRPVVTQLHTAYFETFQIDFGKRQKFSDRFINWMEKQSVVRSDYIVSSSLYHRKLIADTYGISQQRIENIPLGVEGPFDVAQCRREIKTILYVGRLEKRKGALLLLESIPAIVKDFPRTEFVFIGKDRKHAPGGISFEDYFLKEYPMYKDSVKFLGYMEQSQLKGFYERSDIFVLPSVCENFGLVYAEAMMYGKPVIGCRATAVPEVIQDGETGLLIDPNSKDQLINAIKSLLRDEQRRIKIGQQARISAQKSFTIETMVDRTEKFYKEIVEQTDGE